jgi:uncharacterized protein
MISMELVKKIKQDSINALKEKNKEKLSSLRLLLAELEKEKIKLKTPELTDSEAESVINRQIKKLDKEIEAYVAVNRNTDSQHVERELLLTYLPKQLSEEEIREVVAHAVKIFKEGEINHPMPYLSARLKGKADMSLVIKIVKEELRKVGD